MISSRDSIVSLERFADLAWLKRYKALKKDPKTNRMMPAHPINTGYSTSGAGFTNYGRRCLTYVYPITPFTSNFSGALVFNIFEDRLLKMYQSASGSNIVMFDENQVWLTGVENVDYEKMVDREDWMRIFDPETPASGYFFSGIDRHSYQFTYHRSFDKKYILLSVADLSILMEKVTSFQLVFMIYLLFLIPFATLLIAVVSRRLYNPIGQLVRELSASGHLDLNGAKDEWAAVMRAVNELLQEERSLFSDRRREKLIEATFLHILKCPFWKWIEKPGPVMPQT